MCECVFAGEGGATDNLYAHSFSFETYILENLSLNCTVQLHKVSAILINTDLTN